jgi:pimeloyl-ACP methyl ester carboxylesterase
MSFRNPFLALLVAAGSLVAAPASRGSLVELGPVENRPVQQLKAEYEKRLADELGPKAGTFAALGPAVVFQQLIQEHLSSQVPSRRVKYTSRDDKGQDRTYSGRVFMPARKPGEPPVSAPLVVYQHGTETRRSFVPYYGKGDETLFGSLAADLCGFVVAMPDGDGMGADPSSRRHAYCQADTTAACVLDMIRAVLNGEVGGQRIFDDTNFVWDGEVYLVGYSEGGYITMAAVKALSTQPEYADIKLTGAACMGGPLDLGRTIRDLLSPTAGPYDRPYIPAYFITGWEDLYPDVVKASEALNPDLLRQDTNGDLVEWLRGGLGGDQITPMIQARLAGKKDKPVPARKVMNEAWVRSAVDDPRSRLNQLLDANSLVGDWKPDFPVLLVHDPYDKTVPAAGTLAMFDRWTRLGADPIGIVKMAVGSTGTGHVGGALVAIPTAFIWIDAGMPRTLMEMAKEKIRAAIQEAAPPSLEGNAEALNTSLGLQEANENRALLPLSRIDVPAGAAPCRLVYSDRLFKIGKVKVYTLEKTPVFSKQSPTRGLNGYTRLLKEMKKLSDEVTLQPGTTYYLAVYPEKGGVALTLGFRTGDTSRTVNIKQVKNKIIGRENGALFSVSTNFKANVDPAGFDKASDGKTFIVLPQ